MPVTPLFTSVCFSYRPQRRLCTTSCLQHRPWTATPSQKAGPPPAGPAELLSPQTSEKAWPRPTTPSERCDPKFTLSKLILLQNRESQNKHSLTFSHSSSTCTVDSVVIWLYEEPGLHNGLSDLEPKRLVDQPKIDLQKLWQLINRISKLSGQTLLLAASQM